MEIVKRGAEAILYLENNLLVKERIRKGYRIKEIDDDIRKNRTKKEAKLLSEARRARVSTPKILDVSDFKIKMEFLTGKRLKELINSVSDEQRSEIGEKIGKSVGLLHENGMIHGDLTTSNMILQDEKIYFIDFGLGEMSKRIEDHGTDLAVLKEAFTSTHFKYLDLLWQSFISGYKQTNTNWDKTLKVLENIEKRGRYIERGEIVCEKQITT